MQLEKTRMSKKKFRIGELSKELRVKKFVIRFWEKEFSLRSDRSQGGQRYYTQTDLQTFQTIKDLLYHQGYTIAGAKTKLREPTPTHHETSAAPLLISPATATTIAKIPDYILKQIQDLKKQLTEFKKLL